MKQSIQAKLDVDVISKFVDGVGPREPRYASYRTFVCLRNLPDNWDDYRIGAALIDYVDGGWSPFGGRCNRIHELVFEVVVYTD